MVRGKFEIQETSIELVIIGEDGIVQSICEQPVFGTIKDIAILPSNDKFRTQNPQVSRLLGEPYSFLSSFLHFKN